VISVLSTLETGQFCSASPRQTIERVLIQIRYARTQRQCGATHTDAFIVILQGDACLGMMYDTGSS
jgi:hypothetical protein